MATRVPTIVFLAVRAEVGDGPLVHTEQPVHATQRQHRQVNERAEPAVAHQQVSGAQPRVQHPHLGLLVREQRKAQHLHDQAAERVEQPHHTSVNQIVQINMNRKILVDANGDRLHQR